MKLYDYEIAHNRTVRALAPECTLLLRSDGSFPLEKPCPIALFGNGARATLRGGTGSGDVYSRHVVNIEDGLTASGFTVTSTAWLDAYDELKAAKRAAWIKQMKREHRGVAGFIDIMGLPMPEPSYELPLDFEGDAAIYVLSRVSGEGSDRTLEAGDICLTPAEVRDINELNRRFARFMLVLNVGGVVDLSDVDEVRTILLLSQLGALTGEVLADLVLGRSYPSGKLTCTWARPQDYCPAGEFGDRDDTRYREGVYVGYRYFDTVGKRAPFPFGFGLSYTAFAIKPIDVSADESCICATVRVTNTGGFRGKEVVQLYVSVPSGEIDQPYQTLVSFAKTPELEPGASCDVVLRFSLADVASYSSAREAYILEPGPYVLRVGSSSANTQVAAVLELDGLVVARTARPAFGSPGFEDWRPDAPIAADIPDIAPLRLHARDFTTINTAYDAEEDIDPFVAGLTDDELCLANVGSFSGSVLSIIGNASAKVAGAAGDFTRTFESRGWPGLVCADGPAGLRIALRYVRDEKGVHAIGNEMLDAFKDIMPSWLVAFMRATARKPKRGETVHEQPCTMIPIGTAVAQSFNVDVARALGDIVGDEMERCGVDVWLAPAMNIHRDIRCGRNFEYYSEDPLVSGLIAAAVVRGVQAHPGRCTTVKHVAANNQETNRYGNNSLVSERALRDIYLRGFGICVREGRPDAVMTSYNLINGTHTAQHRGLIDDVLRREFGFEGIVMTDWIVAAMPTDGVHEPPASPAIAAAGGNVMMPGSKKDYQALRNGLAQGAVTRAQLEVNATRMYRLAKRLGRP